MKRSKRYIKLINKFDKNNLYSLDEAIELVKKLSTAKFDEGIEIHVKTGIDPKKGDQQIRSTVILPHGNGKKLKILVFADEKLKKEIESKNAILADNETIKQIKQTKKCDFDVVITTPQFMKELAQIARILGPKGLMPSPKTGTVTTNVLQTIDELNKGKVSFKNDSTANIHILIGKKSFDNIKLKENAEAFLNALKKSKPSSAKGQFIKSISICSTMGPGIKVQYIN